MLVGRCKHQLNAISKESGVSVSFENLSKSSVEDALEKVNPNSEAPMTLPGRQKANWVQFFNHFRSESQEIIKRILNLIIYVEPKLLEILVEIDECAHFKQVAEISKSGELLKNSNLSGFSSTFFKYCTLCKRLNDYLETNDKNQLSSSF